MKVKQAKRNAAQKAQAAKVPAQQGRGRSEATTKVRRPARGGDPREARRRPENTARKPARRPNDAQPRQGRTRDPRALQHGPATTPIRRPARPTSTSQAKARAKARKAKAPKIVRVPLRERLITRIASIDLSPRRLVARVPFVVLVIGALGVGLGVTLWLSTDAAERSYQLGAARSTNQALLQQKEGLERDVLEAQAAPALAEAARNLGMIPSRDTAHLVQDPGGNWIVVGDPKPAEGVPPPPLNIKLPDENPAPAAVPAPTSTVERPVRVPGAAPLATIPVIPVIPGPAAPAPEGVVPPPAETLVHAPAAQPAPGAPLTGPAPGPQDPSAPTVLEFGAPLAPEAPPVPVPPAPGAPA